MENTAHSKSPHWFESNGLCYNRASEEVTLEKHSHFINTGRRTWRYHEAC